jgi:antitoxin (DNA-binding transcriptional repressor) of toxin-antitoxin stability system
MDKINATKLKQEVSTVLDLVNFKNQQVTVYRYDKPVAKIIPYKQKDNQPINKKEQTNSTVNLPHKLEDLIEQELDRGLYSTKNEIISAALRKFFEL